MNVIIQIWRIRQIIEFTQMPDLPDRTKGRVVLGSYG